MAHAIEADGLVKTYPGGAPGPAVLVAASVLIGVVLAALSDTLALLVRDRNTIIGLNVMLPLTFLSSAFMAEELMPSWIRHAAAVNPVSTALDASRAVLSGDPAGVRPPCTAPGSWS